MAGDSSLAARPGSVGTKAGRALRVLVVDDYPGTAESMARVLRLYGHEVEIALEGCEALRQAQAKPPDVVLLDISLPGLDGYSVAKQLRAQFGQQLWLIAITALGSPEDHQRCLAAGMDLHLVKPADSREVQHLLQQVAEVLRVAGRL